jgi:hypothetical protein
VQSAWLPIVTRDKVVEPICFVMSLLLFLFALWEAIWRTLLNGENSYIVQFAKKKE